MFLLLLVLLYCACSGFLAFLFYKNRNLTVGEAIAVGLIYGSFFGVPVLTIAAIFTWLASF